MPGTYDFYDQLKSRSRGYASFDYEITGYQKSDLVKLDILVAGESVDALGIIVHRNPPQPVVPPWPADLRPIEAKHSAPVVQSGDSGGHRWQNHCPRNLVGTAQRRNRQMLRR